MNADTLYLTVDQCAARYSISKRHFQTLVTRGDMPQPIKLGGVNRWSIRVLEEFESELIDKNSVAFEMTLKPCRKKRK